MDRRTGGGSTCIVEGKTIQQVNSFVYLGGTVCEAGESSKEI